MASKELRGASRREFIRGAFALGAAMGWGPSRIMDLIARGAGEAAAVECGARKVQNLVIFVGSQGAHGYPSLLWPHPDSFTDGRFASSLSVHFLQDSSQGGQGTTLNGALLNTVNYNAPPAMSAVGGGAGLGGSWAAGERFKKIFGVDNQAFRGFKSQNAQSQGLDASYWGSSTIPSNVGADKGKNFIVMSRETPWLAKYGLKKAITSIDGGGINPFHINGAHNHFIDFNKKWSVMAAAATVQLSRPTITPVIMVGDMGTELGNTAAFYGNLPGAPTPALVATGLGMIDLFNSNAAKAGGALSNPKNATLFEAYTKGMLGTSKTATLPTVVPGLKTAKLGANLVGLNLSDKLLPTDADRLRYGFTGSSPPKLTELRDRMIITAKALQLGLSAQVVMSYFGDDPHDLFSSGGNAGINASTAATVFANFLNAFMDDLMGAPDPFCPGVKLGDNTVVAFLGDVPRTGVNHGSWNDPTYGGQNRAWIMSNGLLRTGFFGGDRARFAGEGITSNDASARGPGEGGLFDPNTGDFMAFDPAGPLGLIGGQDLRIRYGETAMAALLYAVAGGDDRRVNDFYSGKPYPALVNEVII